MMEWMQEIGAILIVAAVVLMWAAKYRSARHREKRLWIIAFVALSLVGIIDLVLIAQGAQTITQFVQSLGGPWSSAALMVFLILHTGLVFGLRGFITVLLGTIWGHLFW
jgi:hypothetical protein